MTRALRFEDLALAAWNAVAVPLLTAAGGAPLLSLGEPADPLAGLVQLLAVIGAIVAVATRPAGVPLRRVGPDEAHLVLIGPLIGAVAFVAGSASSHLGLDLDGPVVGIAFVAIVAALLLGDRLPTIDAGLRRALVLPFVLVCAGIFDGFAAGLLRDLDVVDLLSSATVDESGFAIFVIGMLLAALAAFYAALVVAPRVLIATDSVMSPVGCLIWPARFVVFVVSALFGIGWVVALA